jgi:ubiquinone/menaquinone biosynthesis C-methylase UbiE
VVAAAIAARVWSRRDPGPMPYVLRWVLRLPRGPQSPRNLKRILQPRSGERILEIGPGIGTHELPIASSLLPDGALDVLDVQQEMLDELDRRAARDSITNIIATRGDALALPYSDHTFDAAYLIGVLGEVPDQAAALRELRRVLKPAGRLIVGEVVVDPDYIASARLKEEVSEAGLIFEQKAGPFFAYFALFRTPTESHTG